MQAIIYFMETKATFNLREPKREKPTNINMICPINGKQIKINIGTQFNIYPKHWDKKTQTAIVNNSLEKIYIDHHTEVNNRIKECLKLFDEWKQYIAENTNLIYNSEELLKKYINGETNNLETNPIEWFYYYLDTHSTAKESSKAQYRRNIKAFETFIKEKKIRLNSFSQFTYDTLIQYRDYLLNKSEDVKTIINKIDVLTLLLRQAEKFSLIDLRKNRIASYKNLPNKIKDDNKIYLTDDEINKIYSLKMTGEKKIVRDIFIVQCYLGQRISDIGNLENATIIEDKIDLYQKKTNTHVTILLNPIAKNILSEYNNAFPKRIANNNSLMNKQIKEIAKEAGINEEITYREQKGKEIETKKVEKWELVTTHTARHSFITNFLKKDYSKEMIKKVTGHKTDFAFQKYNNITQEDATNYFREKEKESIKEQPIIKQIQEKQIDSFDFFEWDSEEMIKEYLITRMKEVGIFNTNHDTKVFIDTIIRYYFSYKDKFNSETDLHNDIDITVSEILKYDDKFSKDTLSKVSSEITKRYWGNIEILL